MTREQVLEIVHRKGYSTWLSQSIADLILEQRQEATREALRIVEAHIEHGEFAHAGRYECVDEIARQILASLLPR